MVNLKVNIGKGLTIKILFLQLRVRSVMARNMRLLSICPVSEVT